MLPPVARSVAINVPPVVTCVQAYAAVHLRQVSPEMAEQAHCKAPTRATTAASRASCCLTLLALLQGGAVGGVLHEAKTAAAASN